MPRRNVGESFQVGWSTQPVQVSQGRAKPLTRQCRVLVEGQVIADSEASGVAVKGQDGDELWTGRVERVTLQVVGSKGWLEATRNEDGTFANWPHGPFSSGGELATLGALLAQFLETSSVGRPKGTGNLDHVSIEALAAEKRRRRISCPKECGERLSQLHMAERHHGVSEDVLRARLRRGHTDWRSL